MSDDIMAELKKFLLDFLDKSVVTTTGQMIGTLNNLGMNRDSGEVVNILVTPSYDQILAFLDRDSDGRYILPLRSIRSMEDVVVVDLAPLQKRN